MRVVFMGTPDFAVGTLETLIAAGHEVAAVVTQPDKPKGRGKSLMPTPVKEVALAHQIPVFQPKKVRDPEFVETLRTIAPDVMWWLLSGRSSQRKFWICPDMAASMCMPLFYPLTGGQRLFSGLSSMGTKNQASRSCV